MVAAAWMYFSDSLGTVLAGTSRNIQDRSVAWWARPKTQAVRPGRSLRTSCTASRATPRGTSRPVAGNGGSPAVTSRPASRARLVSRAGRPKRGRDGRAVGVMGSNILPVRRGVKAGGRPARAQEAAGRRHSVPASNRCR